MSQHIDLFNQQSARLLSILWESFPEPQVIAYSAFNADYSSNYLSDPESSEAKEIDKRRHVLHNTLNFLSENNYINYEDKKNSIYLSNVRLTEKGFAILSKSQKDIQGEESYGDIISREVKKDTIDIISKLMTSLFDSQTK